MAAPRSAYYTRLRFKIGTSNKDQWVAKFLVGTSAQGGYYDNAAQTITNASKITAFRNAIKELFHLDGLYCVSKGNVAMGFVGFVQEGGTNAGYHRLDDSLQASRRGHKITRNGVTYRCLNDAGLNTMGDGSLSIGYAFANAAAIMASVKTPFYLGCTYTLQFRRTTSGSWTTSTNTNLNGSTQIAQRTSLTYLTDTLPSGTGTTLYWQMACANTEGTRTPSGNVTLKDAIACVFAEIFHVNPWSSGNSVVYSGNSLYASDASRAAICMYQSDLDTILSKCAARTWSRGSLATTTAAGLSNTIPVYNSPYKMYENTRRSASDANYYYMLTKDYGIRVSSTGYVTGIFYANECTTPTYQHIRILTYFERRYDTTAGKYICSATVQAAYMDASSTYPDFNTTVGITLKWAYRSSSNQRTALNTVYFANGQTQQGADLTVNSGSGRSGQAIFVGYTDDDSVNDVLVTVDYRLPTTLPVEIEYTHY